MLTRHYYVHVNDVLSTFIVSATAFYKEQSVLNFLSEIISGRCGGGCGVGVGVVEKEVEVGVGIEMDEVELEEDLNQVFYHLYQILKDVSLQKKLKVNNNINIVLL